MFQGARARMMRVGEGDFRAYLPAASTLAGKPQPSAIIGHPGSSCGCTSFLRAPTICNVPAMTDVVNVGMYAYETTQGAPTISQHSILGLKARE